MTGPVAGLGSFFRTRLLPWVFPLGAGTKTPEGGSGSLQQHDLVLFWQRLRSPFLGLVVVVALGLAAGWGSSILNPLAGGRLNAPLVIVLLALGLLADARLRARRADTRALPSLLLDVTAIALGLAVLQVEVHALVTPFLYATLTAVILLPFRRALLVWGYTALLAAGFVLTPPLAPWLGGPPEGVIMDVAVWAIIGVFGHLCLWETAVLIAELRRSAQARQAEVELESRRKDEFLSGVSHALRTPLTCVVGFGQLLERDWVDQMPVEAGEMLAYLNQQADVMHGMLDNLFVRAQDEEGSLVVTTEPTDLREIAAGLIRTLAWLYPNKVIRLAGDHHVIALADPFRVRQVVRNLLSNAVQHGGQSIVIEVGRGPQATLSVTDDWPGPVTCGGRLPISILSKVNPAVAAPSLGFGLPVSVRLAELMGGELTHQHTPGVNTFTLSLPLKPASVDTAAPRRDMGIWDFRSLDLPVSAYSPSAGNPVGAEARC